MLSGPSFDIPSNASHTIHPDVNSILAVRLIPFSAFDRQMRNAQGLVRSGSAIVNDENVKVNSIPTFLLTLALHAPYSWKKTSSKLVKKTEQVPQELAASMKAGGDYSRS